MSNDITTSQTVGPYPHAAWQWAADLSASRHLRTDAATVTIEGVIYDGAGAPVSDAQIEAWQPAAAAAEEQQMLPGFRRVPSDGQGAFSLRLSLVEQPPGAPLALLTVFARGLLVHQFSAVFLDDDSGLQQSALLAQVPAERRATLLARHTGAGRYRWDIHLQGPQETVFFDYA
ncbi:protocatechuate 3,4-dioxygenase [Janthinobacterium agaricidamnosum]|uniref:Protocatechuate 3,4-dioxygenase alpha chain protein n=1 Tax=Janthinobacterium agaricidamnosum NBRC 102515 = DSM 9628 TaxID=1349767 RepID=W0V2A9_9BURK|nr:protocatechuate 3,4-dioxygenase [Janthinobacterium agaricidamnosum]CDG81770.1 protocatechuate 3,4-dioxygenase alpha chain protein [Janthinobacterium agaricidamnosum NBRC 102515 = DSM 9628]